ncbi:MAG: apolipoprotein N-acyltransferase [Acidimicrobiales bacterium]
MLDLTPAGWPVAALFFALVVATAGWITRRSGPTGRGVPRRPRPGRARPLECAVRWGPDRVTVAMASVSAPWAITARLFGSPFLVIVTATVAVALVEVRRRPRLAFGLATAAVAATAGGHLAGGAVDTVGRIDIAVVQGGGPQNTRADVCENRAVFERHVAATEQLTTADAPDLILWPENVVNPSPDGTTTPARCDRSLLTHAEALERLQALAVDTGATLVAGWFERAPDGEANVNYSMVIGPDGTVGDRYDKVRLVPFGEFVPLRSVIEQFSSELPGLDVRPGTDAAVLDSALGPLGVSISWEIFFDGRARDAIGNGGRVLLNPTNGSSYWLTIVQSQQVASSRLRALETDRWVLQAADQASPPWSPPTARCANGPGSATPRCCAIASSSSGRTPAVRLGPWPVLVYSLGMVGFTLIGTGRTRRDEPTPPPPPAT